MTRHVSNEGTHAPLERRHLVDESKEAVPVLVLPVAAPDVEEEDVADHAVVNPLVPLEARAEAREEPGGQHALGQRQVQGHVRVEERRRVQVLGPVQGQPVEGHARLGQPLHEHGAVLQGGGGRRRCSSCRGWWW